MAAFYRDSAGIYRCEALSGLPWLDHGFGTRHAAPHPSPITLRQVHSDIVLLADSAAGCKGDALIASRPGEVVAVKTADCVPVLLVDPEHRVAAAVHAGWRGSVGEIARKALQRMRLEFGSVPAEVRAAIGPAIGPCCYEVGPEVAVQFEPFFPERNDLRQKTRVNLWESNRRQLVAAGLEPEAIFISELCTFCQEEEFFSHRRDNPATGRMLSSAGIR